MPQPAGVECLSGLAGGLTGVVLSLAGPVPRSAMPLARPMLWARTVQNPGERAVQCSGPSPATPPHPPVLIVITGKLLDPAAKLSR